MRVCPNCQAAISETANFCDHCGRPFRSNPVVPHGAPLAPDRQSPPASGGGGLSDVVVCSACGYRNVPGEMFCQNCGVQLAPVASVPPPPPRPVSGKPPEQKGICPECGAAVGPKDVYCPNCGAKVKLAGAPLSGITTDPVLPLQSAPAVMDLPPASPAQAAFPELYLTVKDSGKQLSVKASRAEVVIGRSDPVRGIFPDLDLTPYGGDTHGVSRQHARLLYRDEQFHVEDLNSTNFTFLNQQRLQPGQAYSLKDGDELRIGLLVLQVAIH